MVREKIGLLGVYDQRFLQKLKNVELDILVFDCRPKSLQFVQGYKILEILNLTKKIGQRIILLFENEKPQVIHYLVNSIFQDAHIDRREIEIWYIGNLLPMLGDDVLEGCSLKIPFHFENPKDVTISLEQLQKIYGERWKGFFFWNDGDVFSGIQTTTLSHMMQSFQKNGNLGTLNSQLIYDKEHSLVLFAASSFPHAMVNFFDIKEFIFGINQDVEVCYRNLDFDKLNESFYNLKKEIHQIF